MATPTFPVSSTLTATAPFIDSSQPNIPEELLCKEPKKEHLMMLLHSMKYMWNVIGKQLQVPYDAIKFARYNEAYSDTRQLSEVLQVWIDKRTCEVSWRMIITVVKKPPIEHKLLADNMYKFLSRSDIQNEYLSSYQPGNVFTTFNPPPPNQSNSPKMKVSSQEILKQNLQEGYVLLTIIKLILMGPPGVGKTSFKSLLFNWPPVLQHHSTSIASRPVQAIERMIGLEGETIWEKVSAERLLNMLAAAMNVLTTDRSIISEDSDHNTSSHSNLVEDSSGFTQAITTVPMQKASEVQPDPSFYSEKIIKEIEKGEVSGELSQSKWIYLLDSGGQPHFTDVSRAFIRSNAVYYIAIKLTDKLSDRPPFIYSLEGKPLSNPNTDLCMTNLQLIKHFVGSIVSSESSKTGAKSLIFIIGTCSDLYYLEEPKMESITEKNKQLVAELEEFRDYLVFHDEIKGELIHPVNNIISKGEGRERISSELRQKIVNQVNKIKVEKIQVPIRWFVFEIMMKDEVSKEGLISLDTCREISQKLCMKDLMECLEYLDTLSLILYFKSLPNVIFIDPQYLLDMLSNMISVSFIRHSYLPPGVQDQLKTKGIFKDTLLDELKSIKFVPSLFEKQDFLRLLTDLCIVAPTSYTEYFIPVVLPEKEKDREKLKHGIVEPLLIKFDIGVVPQGVFLNVVVGLLNRKHSPKFRIDPVVEQLRNAIELFSDDFSASVVLIEDFHWIEVYFYCDEEVKCHKFKDALGESISNCAKRLGYDSAKLNFVTTVPCQLPHSNGPYSFHPVILNEESGKINCSIEKRQCSKLSDRQIQCWFPSCMAKECVSTSLKILLDEQPDLQEITTNARTAEWNLLGVQLKLDSVDLRGCTDLTRMYQLWIQQKAEMATRKNLLTALRSIRENNVASQYENYLRTKITKNEPEAAEGDTNLHVTVPSDGKTDYQLKVIFLGDVSVGKTSLITRFMYNSYGEQFPPTISSDFLDKTILLRGRTVKLQLWDTAGQERFQSITSNYFRNSSIAVVVYDITDRESFDAVDECVRQVREERCDNVAILIVGNKVDLQDNRQISNEKGKKKAQKLRAIFGETSAKTGYNVEELLTRAVLSFIDMRDNQTNNDHQMEAIQLTSATQSSDKSPRHHRPKCSC